MKGFLILIILSNSKIMPSLKEILKNSYAREKIAVLVHLKEKPNYELIKNLPAKKYVEFLKRFSENSQKDILNYLKENFPRKIEEIKPYWIFNGFYLKAEKDVILRISEREEVDYIIEDFIIKIEKPEISYESRAPEWNIKKIKADSCWMAGYTGEGIIIGHMDTGVDTSHPALEGKFEGHWYDAINGQTNPYDDHGHGTHVMGTILGGDGLGPFTNDIGVAPGAKFVACKICNANGSCPSSAIHMSFQKIAEWKAKEVDIKALNNSWGGSSSLEWWEDIMNLRNLGVISICAWNGGSPGDYIITIGVQPLGDSSLTTPGFIDTSYGRWGVKPNISAPGVNIRSSVPGGGYAYYNGSSFAVPHLTGAWAILSQKNPFIGIDSIYYYLTEYARKPPPDTWPNIWYGWGYLNIYQALIHLPENPPLQVCHNCGEINFCVTNKGSFPECHYPKGSVSCLFYGSFAIGTEYPYVIDNYYESNYQDDNDWVSVEGVYMYEPYPPFCEYSLAVYNDSLGEEIKDVVCTQRGYTFPEIPAYDLVILEFTLKNNGSQNLTGLYSGIFLDWDIGDYTANLGGIDTLRNIAYMYYSNIYLGSAILYPSRDDPRIANLSMINNPSYVYPYGGLFDSIEIKFLNGTYSFPTAGSADDWSTCISTGPFDIPLGDSIIVAYAIAGGNDLSHLQEHVDTAYNRYWNFKVPENYVGKSVFVKILPALSKEEIYISYMLPRSSEADISIFNTAGARVKKLSLSLRTTENMMKISLKELPDGIYIIKVKTPYTSSRSKVILIR